MTEIVRRIDLTGNTRVQFLELLALGLLAAIPASAITYRVIEAPFLRRRTKAPTTPEEPRPGVPAAAAAESG
jgi:peptidoglycan/LPS O-acetylase OafA/YrhL